jgi:radical SAM protein with 4Fe4S-binding SPASM domain
MCDTRTYYEENPGEVMDFEDLIQQLKVLKRRGLVCVVIGGTEPLLTPDICERLDRIQKIGVKPVLITNGTLLNEEMSETLARSAAEIVISLDGATQETNDRIRGLGTFRQTINGISKLVAFRKTLKTHLSINTCITSINLHEMEAIIRLGEKVGVDEVLFQNVDTNERWLKPDKERLAAIFDKINSERYSYKIRIPPALYLQSLATSDESAAHCFVPGLISNVDAYGNVFACWRIKEILGNIKGTPFLRIWVSGKYREFRENVRLKRSAICRECRLLCYTPFNLVFNNLLRHPAKTAELIKGFLSRD